MTEGYDRRVASAPSHLPPLELLPFVDVRRDRYVALEKFETPVDEYGVPDMRALLERLGSTITYSPELEASIDLTYTNLHHAVYTRKRYWQHGKGSFQVKHRENPDVKALMYIPFHNLDHLLGLEPRVAANEVMRQRSIEQDNVLRLHRLGSAALWLDEMALHGMQTYRTAEEYLLRHGLRGIKNDPYGKRILPSHGTFLDHLAHSRPGQLGIMPDIEMLANMELADAVALLGERATKQAAFTAEESTAIILEASRRASGYDLAA